MSDQPEALRLVFWLESVYYDDVRITAAAAELRRLHALVMDQQSEIYGLNFARETERKTLGLVKADLCEQKRIASNEHAEADRVRAERDALRADAERYRWLELFKPKVLWTRRDDESHDHVELSTENGWVRRQSLAAAIDCLREAK